MAAPKLSFEASVEAPGARELSISLLRKGFVDSFDTFFTLSHDAVDASAAYEPLALGPEVLAMVQGLLVSAEESLRRRDTAAACAAYRTLAEHYAGLGEYATAVVFNEKIVGAAMAAGETAAAAAAQGLLGAACVLSGDLQAAIACHEQQVVLGRQMGGAEGATVMAEARASLVTAYTARAAAMERAGDAGGALLLLQKCLVAARDCGDAAREAAAQHRLGSVHLALGALNSARECQQLYRAASEAAADVAGQGRACRALAEIARASSDSAQVASFLGECVRLAEVCDDLDAHARACESLGLHHREHGDHAKAAQFYEKYFELSRSSTSAEGAQKAADGDAAEQPNVLVERSRAALGVARGNSQLAAFSAAVAGDVPALVQWRNRRVPIT